MVRCHGPSSRDGPATPTLTLHSCQEYTDNETISEAMVNHSYLFLNWGHSSHLPPVNRFRRLLLTLDWSWLSIGKSCRTVLCWLYILWYVPLEILQSLWLPEESWGTALWILWMSYQQIDLPPLHVRTDVTSTVLARCKLGPDSLTLERVSFLVVLVDVIEVLHEHLESCLSLLFWVVLPPILDLPLLELLLVWTYSMQSGVSVIIRACALALASYLTRSSCWEMEQCKQSNKQT